MARLAIVIGYSFRDPGIRRIITDTLDLNQNLVYLLICGPNEDYWKKFAQQNLRSYHIIPYYFGYPSKGAPYLETLKTSLAELAE